MGGNAGGRKKRKKATLAGMAAGSNAMHASQEGLKTRAVLLKYSVPKGNLHCQCILSIFPAIVHQFYANILAFVNINPFIYINDQFSLNVEHKTSCSCLLFETNCSCNIM